ncbi:MAG: RHS repeat-associated core domain-containing protein, partial [Clostridia bacterium]|nr:RHS repeat-associated core domain-containing protein [Clostridia bacterium]
MGIINPIRYRGYYYDNETGLYYLLTRYYDSEIGRFISPDSADYLDPTTINGLNLYAYSKNNPVMYYDPSGHFVVSSFIMIGYIESFAIVSAAIGVAEYYASSPDRINIMD